MNENQEGLFTGPNIKFSIDSEADTFPYASDDTIMEICSIYSNDPEEQKRCLETGKDLQRQAKPYLEVGKKGYDLYKKGFDIDTGDSGMFNINPRKKSMEWKIPF